MKKYVIYQPGSRYNGKGYYCGKYIYQRYSYGIFEEFISDKTKKYPSIKSAQKTIDSLGLENGTSSKMEIEEIEINQI